MTHGRGARARSRASSSTSGWPARPTSSTATASSSPTSTGPAATVEHHHRDRAQIEERIKDAKLGVRLPPLPLSDLDANRVWLACSALALNLLALLNDLMFGPEPPGHLPRRRQAKFVRRMLLCIPARIIHHARQIILRLPAGLASAAAFQAAYSAARGLAPPALAA